MPGMSSDQTVALPGGLGSLGLGDRLGAFLDAPAPSAAANQTLMARVLARVKDDIISGALAAGTRLKLKQLGAHYGVGLSPLREALFSLSAEGFVVSESRRGFRVAELTVEEIREVTKLRQVLETHALRESIKNGGTSWEAEVVASFHGLSRLRTADGAEWHRWHHRFHEALAAGARSAILHDFRSHLFNLSHRYRQMSFAIGQGRRDNLAEHRAILEATLAHDVDRACTLLEEHLAITAGIIITALEQRGGTTPA